MAPLAASNCTIRDPETGGDITTFSVDPFRYNPFTNQRRGSIHKVLSGSAVQQDFGVQIADFIVTLDVEITDFVTLRDLEAKQRSIGKVWELRDYLGNRFLVTFAPGVQSFNPVPIRGSCDSFEVSITLYVVSILSYLGSPY